MMIHRQEEEVEVEKEERDIRYFWIEIEILDINGGYRN